MYLFTTHVCVTLRFNTCSVNSKVHYARKYRQVYRSSKSTFFRSGEAPDLLYSKYQWSGLLHELLQKQVGLLNRRITGLCARVYHKY